MAAPKMLPLSEAAALLGVSIQRLYWDIRRGRRRGEDRVVFYDWRSAEGDRADIRQRTKRWYVEV